MGRYRARDLVTPPGLLSLSRVPLAFVFPCVVDRPVLAFTVLAAAGASDVLDGWIARKTGRVTATGAALDPITDKLFVGTVALTLLATHRLSAFGIAALATRELGEAPLVAWVATSRRARRARARQPSANLPGKIATTLQFVSIAAVLVTPRSAGPWIVATAVVGAVAALAYWRRELRVAREEPRGSSGGA